MTSIFNMAGLRVTVILLAITMVIPGEAFNHVYESVTSGRMDALQGTGKTIILEKVLNSRHVMIFHRYTLMEGAAQ